MHLMLGDVPLSLSAGISLVALLPLPAKHGNCRRAAERLHLNVSALMRRLGKPACDVDLHLRQRSSRKVVLTPATKRMPLAKEAVAIGPMIGLLDHPGQDSAPLSSDRDCFDRPLRDIYGINPPCL